MISYVLPLPVSVNALFVELAGKRIKTKAYKAWREEAGWMIAQQGRRHIKGEVAVLIEAVRPDKRQRDIDNLIKGTLDLLVELGVIEEDSMVQEICARWMASGEPCYVTITAAGNAAQADSATASTSDIDRAADR